MATNYLDTNIDDKTQDIIVIDMKPHQRCCNWVKKRIKFDALMYKWRRKWRTWKWYLCYFFFIAFVVTTIVSLKMEWRISVAKDAAGNCPLYSHEVPNTNGKGTSCLRELCFNRGEKNMLDENGYCVKTCKNELTKMNHEENICEVKCLEG